MEENTNEKVSQIIDAIKSKKNKFLICIPDISIPSSSVYELYLHATILKEMEYNVYLLVEKEDYLIPNWIEFELTEHNIISMSNPKINIGPEDVMIIPEIFSNIMEQTKNFPCLRIGFLQSFDYMLNALIPGSDWGSFGVTNVIASSNMLKEYFNEYYKNMYYNIKTYNVGIPEYFKKSDKPQKPVISIVGRNQNDISKFIKLFYAKFPQYQWITFDPMLTMSKPPQPMRRVDFADRLKENFAAVWIDRISSYGTFPLECMKSGVIPICLMPDIVPEYLIGINENGEKYLNLDNTGVWVNNFYGLPEKVGELILKFLDDAIPSDFYDEMIKKGELYSQVKSKEDIKQIYNEFIEERIQQLSAVLNNNNQQ